MLYPNTPTTNLYGRHDCCWFLAVFCFACARRGGLLGMVQFNPLLPGPSSFPRTFGPRNVISHFTSDQFFGSSETVWKLHTGPCFLRATCYQNCLKILQLRWLNTFPLSFLIFSFLFFFSFGFPFFFLFHSLVFWCTHFLISQKRAR